MTEAQGQQLIDLTQQIWGFLQAHETAISLIPDFAVGVILLLSLYVGYVVGRRQS